MVLTRYILLVFFRKFIFTTTTQHVLLDCGVFLDREGCVFTFATTDMTDESCDAKGASYLPVVAFLCCMTI